MAYYITDSTDQDRGRRRRPVLVVVAVLTVLGILAALAVNNGGWGSGGGTVAPPVVGEPPLTWSTVADQPVPVSPRAGPAQVADTGAAGFTHDELGAVLATIHIGVRLTSALAPEVYQTVAREQCVGDVAALLSQIQTARSAAPAEATKPTAYFYKVLGGDPETDAVLISIAADTTHSRAGGGYVAITRTLRWINGDWRLQVPAPPARTVASVDTYQLLGAP
jgi:hypothetical protein